MRIAFGGDCSIIGDALTLKRGNYIQISAYYEADKRIVNLEQCISDRQAVAGKTTIYAPSSAKDRICSLQASCVSLANNHLHDCGEAGIRDTLEYLHVWGIPYVGAGRNAAEAAKGVSIAPGVVLLAYCQFGTHYLRNVCCAKENTPGVNGYSLERVLEDLDRLDGKTQAVVALHWAAEYVPLPPSEIIIWARKILAHPNCCLLIGHHPHIFLGKITSHGKEGYISMGNLMFPNFYLNTRQELCVPEPGEAYARVDMQMKVPCLTKKCWQKRNRQGLLLIYDTEQKAVSDVLFTQQDPELPVTRMLRGKEEVKARKRFERLSRIYTWPVTLYRVACRLCMFFTYAIRKIKRVYFYHFAARHKEIYR